MRMKRVGAWMVLLAMAGLAAADEAAKFDMAAEAAPAPVACPAGVGEGTKCLAGRDSAGAFYLIAMPSPWNGDLVLHDHGGPFLGAPTAKRVAEDLERWSVMPRLGYAWAASSYRQGGVAVTAAAQDSERLRRLFIDKVAKPRHVFLHGQSWGASVAARQAELFGAGKPYDAVLLTSGVLGGGTRSYDFRLDLRVVYQYLCHNHPLPSEPQYPLNLGLPLDAKLTPAELTRRVDECLGLDKPAAQRSPEQAARTKAIVDVIHIPERSIASHLNWATWHFQDIAFKRTGGASPFGNVGAVYAGSSNDAALNAGVLRYAADPQAKGALAADSQPTGRTSLPTVGLHAIDDPTAFVELESSYRRIRDAAGTGSLLVQSFSSEREHSYLSDSEYPALFAALLDWIDKGEKPTPEGLAQRCRALMPRFDTDGRNGCHIQPQWQPPALESRVPSRAP